MTASQTGNTLQYTAGNTTDIGTVAANANTLTLNGLMQAGSGPLVIPGQRLRGHRRLEGRREQRFGHHREFPERHHLGQYPR